MPSKKPQLPSREIITDISRAAQVALAARFAMRVYPLIGIEGHFDFWGNDAKRHVESIYAAITTALMANNVIAYASDASATAIKAAKAAKVDVAADVATAATNAANGYAFAAYAATDIANAYTIKASAAAYAAYNSSTVSATSATYVDAIKDDFEYLKKIRKSGKIPWLFFQRPLFEGGTSFYDEESLSLIGKAFQSVDRTELLDTWKRFHDGKPPPKEELQDWLDKWCENYQREEENKGLEKVTESIEAETGDLDNEEPNDNSDIGKIIHRLEIASNATDAPASVDRLGRDRLINPLAAMLSLPEQKTPLTIGLFGHWGAGKSSLMRMLQMELSENKTYKIGDKPEFLFSWFNCWEYEHTENIPAGLAQEVVRGLLTDGSYQESERHYTKEVGCLKKLGIRLRYLLLENRLQTIWLLGKCTFVVLLTLGSVITFFIDPTVFSKVLGGGIFGAAVLLGWRFFKQGEVLWNHPLTTELATFFKLPSYRKELGLIPAIRRQLESLCKVRLYRKKRKEYIPIRRLVVFVDDLDRCKPETIARAFDAIRLITDIPEVIVIVGIDERIAFKAMGEAYKDYADPKIGRRKEDVARDYLGKIIQVPIRLSPPADKELQNYIDEVLFPAEFRRDEETAPIEASENRDTVRADTEDDIDSSETETSEAEPDIGLTDLPKPFESEPPTEEELTELMKETDEEVKTFFEFTCIFDFSNPRQLLRLRNSYRLLKGIFPEALLKKFSTEEATPDYEYTLMLMLFWLEFRTQSTMEEIDVWLKKGELIADTETEKEDPRKSFRTDFFKAIDKKVFSFNTKNRLLIELEQFTKICILPYPTKEAALKDPEAPAENAE